MQPCRNRASRNSTEMPTQTPLISNMDDGAEVCSQHFQMAQQTAVNNALGTLLGYLGSEVATPDIFERLMWPTRFYNGFDVYNAPKMMFFMPMGGPLHKAALMTLDKILSNGLFKGRNQGHMLGSTFYHDTNLNYTAYDCVDPKNKENELVRNGFWTQVIACLPIPYNLDKNGCGPNALGGRAENQIVRSRAIHRVSHLKLSVPAIKPPTSQIINGDTGAASLKTYLALAVTETTGIVVAAAVLIVWKSWFALLWLIPLILKLTSASLALDRHALHIPAPTLQYRASQSSTKQYNKNQIVNNDEEKPLMSPHYKKFEVHGLQEGFLIIEGDENLVLQFFRHYGHPVRNRFREYAQVIITILFGFIFPAGLLCSLLWMPLGIQYVWLAYELYATCAMHVYRFAGGRTWATTEERISKAFIAAAARGQPQRAFLGGDQGVLMAELEVTYHNRYRGGRTHCDELLDTDSPWSERSET